MKHTMKKLLCMALAIMLLVSAVPVFAMAEGEETGFTVTLFIRNTDDDGAYLEGLGGKVIDEAAGSSYTAQDYLDYYLPGWSATYKSDDIVFYIKGQGGIPGDTPITSTCTLSIALNPIAPPSGGNNEQPDDNEKPDDSEQPKEEVVKDIAVKILYDGNKAEFNVTPANKKSVVVRNVLTSRWNAGWADSYTFVGAKSTEKGDVTLDSVINGGDSLTITLKSKSATSEPTTPPATGKITVTIKIGTTVKVDAKTYNAESATINELIRNWNSNWYDDYMLTSYKVGGTTVSAPKTSDVIYAGQTVTINLSKREKEALHDKLSNLKPVILHVYLNNNFNAEDAHYTITSIAEDGTLDLNNDVKNFLKSYYTAKTSDGITYDGMYVADGYFGVKYLADAKYVVLGNDADETGNTTLDRMRSEGYVHLNVMLTNAKAKSSSSSSTADSSNPKTGDTIFVPVMVMGVTATALAAAYVFGKKRFAH